MVLCVGEEKGDVCGWAAAAFHQKERRGEEKSIGGEENKERKTEEGVYIRRSESSVGNSPDRKSVV